MWEEMVFVVLNQDLARRTRAERRVRGPAYGPLSPPGQCDETDESAQPSVESPGEDEGVANASWDPTEPTASGPAPPAIIGSQACAQPTTRASTLSMFLASAPRSSALCRLRKQALGLSSLT